MNYKDFMKNRGFKEELRTRANATATQAKFMGEQAAKAHLAEEGYEALADKLKANADNIRIGGFGALLELGFTVWGTSSRMKQGEAFLPALSKEIVENAIYGIAPWLIVGTLGKMGVEMYPHLHAAASQKKYFYQNMNYLGGNYLDTETNYASRARAMEHIKRTRGILASGLGQEARRYHR